MALPTRLLIPTAAPAKPRLSLHPRPAYLTRVAFLHNGQPSYDEIAPALLALLEGRPGLTVRLYRKPRYSSPAAPELLEEIAATCEAAVVGLAY